MELSYEETMRRIEEYDKNDPLNRKCCREKKFPFDIDLYKGENQIIIVPLITTIGWFSTAMAWYRQITDVLNAHQIGATIFDVLEHIRNSPVDARTRKERDEDDFRIHSTTCKSYKAFNKKYLCCGVHLHEDGKFIVSQIRKLQGNNGYGGNGENLIHLLSSASADDLGEAVLKSFAAMEEFYHSNKNPSSPVPRGEFETLSDMKVSFEIPQDENYTDEQDYHTAEIYQGYSYSKDNADEAVADMYFGIAAELDCDISSENIRKVWEENYGTAEKFEVIPIKHALFDYRAEMVNQKSHCISYLKQVDDSELLACELVIKAHLSGKRLDSKITKDFEGLVKSCKLIN